MKKLTACILMITIFLACFSSNTFASDSISAWFSLKEEIKYGKSFYLYLSISSDTDMGAVQGNIAYDAQKLKLSDISLENKQYGDYFSYGDSDGSIEFIYMSKADSSFRKMIQLKFTPISDDEGSFSFSAAIAQALDKNSDPIGILHIPELTAEAIRNDKSVSGAGSVSVTEKTESSVKQPSSGSSQKNSGSEGSKSESSESESRDSEIKEYSIVFEDNTDNSFDNAILIVGMAAALAVTFAVAFRFGRHSGGK